MISTMAPLDQSQQLGYDLPSKKRSDSYERWRNVRRDDASNGGQGSLGNKGERDNGFDNGGGDGGNGGGNEGGNGGGNGGNNGGGDRGNGKKDNGEDGTNSPAAATTTAAAITPPLEASTIAPNPTSSTALLQPDVQSDPTPLFTQTSVAVATEAPTSTTTAPPLEPTTTELPPEPTISTTPIVAVPSTTITTPIATITESPSPITAMPFSTSSSWVSSTMIATTTMSASVVITSITATTTEVLVLTTSTSERKGEKSHDHSHTNATTTASAFADNTSGNNSLPALTEHSGGRPLSPTAEHILLAAGIIGALIIGGFLFYLFLRMRKIDVGGKFDNLLDRYPRLERILSVIPAIRKRSRWSRRSSSPAWDKDESHAYESSIPPTKSMGTFYSSSEKSTIVASPTSGHDSIDFSEKAVSYGMSTNPLAPLTITNPSAPSATMSVYNVQPPAKAYIPDAARMSELSSLSSGFGDAQIDVPESGPSTQNTGTLSSNITGYDGTLNSNAATLNTIQPYRQSFMQRASRAFVEPLTSRFSWTTANKEDPPTGGQRDTVYTTTSEDSAPRFRTIHSWVNQQTTRVAKGRTEPVPSMPPLPPSQRHIKHSSEAPAFQHHPGDQVNIPEATRIESVILDRKLGAGV